MIKIRNRDKWRKFVALLTTGMERRNHGVLCLRNPKPLPSLNTKPNLLSIIPLANPNTKSSLTMNQRSESC